MTDVLNPELVWIEGRCYRVNEPTQEAVEAFQEYDFYDDNEVIVDEDADMEDEGEMEKAFDIETIDSTRFSTSLHVAKQYHGAIIGKKGAVKSRLEQDTKTDIKIPRQFENKDIVIFGPSPSNVKAARRRINQIVLSSRLKNKGTHFISIPMHSEGIMNNFNHFKESILKENEDASIEESLFQIPIKLHLTIGMLCLMDDEERLYVSKLLTEAKDTVIMPLLKHHMPVKLRAKGLSYMNDDPKQIDVLYCDVVEDPPSGLMQKLANAIVEYFSKAGFMDQNEYGREQVLIHMTLINSRYRGNTDTSSQVVRSQRPHKRREPFDGTTILEKYKDFDFGVAELKEIHLSQLYNKRPDGYYMPTCLISLED